MAEIAAEPVNPATANHAPLGIGEASGGPTVAVIGNAVAHALAGAGIREGVMRRRMGGRRWIVPHP